MFAVFRRRDFSLLWLAQLVSTAGSALTDLAAGIYVWRATESALAVGLTLMVTAVPSLVVGLLAGVYVDRHDRKRIMIATCLVQAVTVGLIAVVIGIDQIALIGLYVLLLLNAGVKQFFDPAHDSLIPEIASDEELAAANSFLSIASFGSTAVGFAGAGLLAGTVGLQWAFVLDAASFLFAAGCIIAMGRYPMPTPDEDASVQVIVENLKSGMRVLFGTPIIRSLFIVGAFMFFSFGLWNVLLLPFSLQVLGATEFQYGLQEGLTSVGFVLGSFFMARFSSRLPEPAWIVLSMTAMGICGVLYGLSTQIGVAIALVMISGFFNSPSSVSRSVLLQRNTPREMRGRVFSSFYVMRDVVFLFGMAGAGLADVVDIRLLIVVSSSLLFVSAAFTLVAPGLAVSTWGAASARLRGATAAPALAAATARAATLADFDRLAGRLGAFTRLSPDQRAAFVGAAKVLEVEGGTRVVEHGDAATSAYFILDGSTTAGIPVDDGYQGLSTMTAGDFFGEIGALTGSLRTADVVADVDTTLIEVPADALRATMLVPEISQVVLSTMSNRLQRTEAADLPRLAGIDQADLRDLRTPRPSVEVLPRPSDQQGEPVA
jgi:MFS family permease